MNNSRRSTALWIVVVALSLQGCAYIVSPTTRGEWCNRLAAAQMTLSREREDIEAAGKAAYTNQLGFIDEIEQLRGPFPPKDVPADDCEVSRQEVTKWAKSQEDAVTIIKDIEQDILLLRDEMMGDY